MGKKTWWDQFKSSFWKFQAGPHPGAKPYSKKKQAPRKGPVFIPTFAQQMKPLPAKPAVHRPKREIPKKFEPNKLLQPEVLPKKDIPKKKPRVPKGKVKIDKPAEWENKGKPSWNEVLNDPALRVEEIAEKPAKRNKLFYPSQITVKQRSLYESWR